MISRASLRRGLWLWLPVAACMGAIQYGSVVPILAFGPETTPHADKLAHVGAYALLSLLLARALRGGAGMRLGDVALVAFIWSTAFGMLQELIQPFVGRTQDIVDALSNAAGSGLAALGWLGAMCWLAARRQTPAAK